MSILNPIIDGLLELLGKLPTFFLVLIASGLLVYAISLLLNAALVFTDRVVDDKIDNGARTGLVTVMRNVGYMAALYFAFQSVQLTGSEMFAAIAGSAVLAVALGAQDLAKDALGGVTMLLNPDIDPNYPLAIAGKVGALKTRGLLSSKLQTTDEKTHVIRNRHFLGDFTVMGRDMDVRMIYGINNDKYAEFKQICAEYHVLCPFTSEGAKPEFTSDPDKVADGSGSTHFFDSNVATTNYWAARQWYDEHLTVALQNAGVLSVFDIGGSVNARVTITK